MKIICEDKMCEAKVAQNNPSYCSKFFYFGKISKMKETRAQKSLFWLFY